MKNDESKNHFILPGLMFQQQSNPTRVPPQVSQFEDSGQAMKEGMKGKPRLTQHNARAKRFSATRVNHSVTTRTT